MASHNIKQTPLLKYICNTFDFWGISYIDQQKIKQAKDDKPSVRPHILKLLFHLVILHLIDYSYTIDELQIKIEHQDGIVEDLIMAHLSEIKCPYLIRKEKGSLLLDLNSSRSLLLIVGWIMGVSDYFSNIKNKLVHKLYDSLYVSKTILAKKTNTSTHLHTQQLQQPSFKDFNSIESRFKRLKTINYKIECLRQKQQRIQQKLHKRLSKYNKSNKTNNQIKIQQLLHEGSICNQKQYQYLQNKLIKILTIQREGIKNQQYFWLWLQMKVIDPYHKMMAQQYADYYEQPTQTTHVYHRIKPLSGYLAKYIKQYNKIESNLNQLNEQIEPMLDSLSSDIKASKGKLNRTGIQKQVQGQIKSIQDCYQNENRRELQSVSFVGIQLKKYLQKFGYRIDQEKPKSKKIIEKSAQEEMPIDQQKQLLKSEVQQFISSLEMIKFL